MSWKKHGSRSYSYSHQTPFGVYNFIALDVCPNPGPKRPYNFFGILHTVGSMNCYTMYCHGFSNRKT